MTKEENEARLARLKSIVASMPEKPGSYQYYDADHTIIYVGKAKNLKRRVSSYFHREVDRYKTKVLVSKIHDISYTVVNTEEDALLLENSLIKKYNPRYNVLLKDGKTYPSICVTNEFSPEYSRHDTSTKASEPTMGRIATPPVCMPCSTLSRSCISLAHAVFRFRPKPSAKGSLSHVSNTIFTTAWAHA